jgi:hypothetical protein
MNDIVIEHNILKIFSTPSGHPWENFLNSITRSSTAIKHELTKYNAIVEWDLLDGKYPYHKITFASDADLTFFLLRFSE